MGEKLLFKIYHEWQLKITPKSIHFQISFFGKISPIKKKGWHPNMRNSYDEKELQLMSYPLYKKKSMYLFKMNSTKNPKKKVRSMKN
jgi:hypothetical protein